MWKGIFVIGDKARELKDIVPVVSRNIPVMLIILAVGTFYFATIRDGHNWGGDFSMYIHHAKNIADGTDYENTGYIKNPFYFGIGPVTYPPIFPLMLSPIYSWFGLNLTVMKVLVILFFLASLWMFFLVFAHELPFLYVLAIITVIAFNPYFWGFKDNVMSDIPFIFFTYVSLFLINKAYNSNQSSACSTLYAVLLGISIYLAYGTRSIGIVLIASLLIYDIIKHKRLSQFTIITVLSFIPFMLLQNIFFHNDSSYSYALMRMDCCYGVMENVYRYAGSLRNLMRNGYSVFISNVLFINMSGLMFIGYLTRIKERKTIFEIFPLLYVVVVIMWPKYLGPRALIPVIPLYIFFAFVGIRYLSHFVKRDREPIIVMMCISVIVISYVGQFTKMDFGPIDHGIGKSESIELFKYVKAKTDKNDVFIFRKPRVLSLFTGRPASVYHLVKDKEKLWNYIGQVDARYVIVGARSVFPRDDTYLREFVREYNHEFEMVYSNVDFDVYKVKREGEEVKNVWRAVRSRS